LSEELPEEDITSALDQADVVKEGKDITLLTYSRMRHHCLKAIEELEKKGIDVELIDLISLKPFDMETISKSIKKFSKYRRCYCYIPISIIINLIKLL